MTAREGALMRNIYEVLKEKENDLERVRQEVEALRLVAPLVADKAAAPVTPIHRTDAKK